MRGLAPLLVALVVMTLWQGAKMKRRLAEMDAARWNTTIQTALLRLQATDPKFGADDLALAQIAQHVALGDLTGLADTGQVATLLARGAANSPKIQASLAGYLTEGIGVPRDPVAGAALLLIASRVQRLAGGVR